LGVHLFVDQKKNSYCDAAFLFLTKKGKPMFGKEIATIALKESDC
jgi:hypothetical protein